MSKILILGGGGMIAQKLARALNTEPACRGAELTLFDVGFPPKGAAGTQITGNIADPARVQDLVGRAP